MEYFCSQEGRTYVQRRSAGEDSTQRNIKGRDKLQELNVASFRQDSNMLLAGEEIRKDDQARGVHKKHEEKKIPSNILIHIWLSLAAIGCSRNLRK